MRIYLLLLFVLMVTRTQATNVIFDRITMDSGLSSSSVTSILKDRTGYVWVGTTEGLNRYDGYTFKVFLPVPDCPESIQSSSIDKLFEDSDGFDNSYVCMVVLLVSRPPFRDISL